MSKENLGEKLRRLRLENNLPLRKVAAALDIDIAILSKMERGERKLTKSIVQKLAKIYNHDPEDLEIHYLGQLIIDEVGEEDLALKGMMVAEEQIRYKALQKNKEPAEEKESIIRKIQDYFQTQNLVTKAWLFGSFARGDDSMTSDIDIMVQFNEKMKVTLFDFAEISHDLELLTKRKIDLVEENNLKPFAQKTAHNDLIKIYG
jgi:predicted nucleotidyltransferase